MQNKKQKTVRITVNVSKGMKEKIAEIMEKSSLMSQTHVVNNAILLLYQKTFKDYIENRPSGKLSVEDKVDFELKKAEVKKQRQDDKQKEICQKLGGKLSLSGNGYTCRYSNYSRHGVYEQELPIDHLTDELVALQFQPNREKLQELIDAGKISITLPE